MPPIIQPRKKRTGIHWSLRVVLIFGVLLYLSRERLFPHGFPVPIAMEDRPGYAPIDKSNDNLQAKHGKLTKIIERAEEGQKPLLKGPETVILDNKGTLYAFSRGAKLIKLDDLQQQQPQESHTMTARTAVAADLGRGAPLSGKFTKDGKTLYVVDPLMGLFRIRNFHEYPTKSSIELVANKVMDNGVLTRILYADDVTIGPKTGKVYFTDASEISPGRNIQENDWDVLYASKVDLIRGKRTGRLLQYDPDTEEVSVLARNLFFANGCAVDKDETYVLVAQTFAMKVSKYHLTGPQQGSLETVIDSHQLTGVVDGVDCSWETSGPSAGKCYVAVPTPVISIMKLLNRLPPPFDQGLRALLLTLPKWLAPKPIDYGCVVEIDMNTGELRTLQDPDATDLTFITGVTVHGNKLYLGSLHSDTIGVYDLS